MNFNSLRQRNIVPILGGIVLAIVLCIGSFYAGMSYQRKHSQRVTPTAQGGFPLRTRVMRRGGYSGGFGMNGGAGRGFRQTSSVSGNIVIISGNQISLQFPNGTVRNIATSSNTTFTRSGQTATQADLKAGQTIIVSGQPDTDGTIAAQSVQIVSPTPSISPNE